MKSKSEIVIRVDPESGPDFGEKSTPRLVARSRAKYIFEIIFREIRGKLDNVGVMENTCWVI